MSVTVIATPGAPDANSYETVAEANLYFDTRVPLTPPWNPDPDTVGRSLITTTRALDTLFGTPHKRLIKQKDGVYYYVTGPTWKGTPTSPSQALAWPRTGIFDPAGIMLPSDIIPVQLKDALSEWAGQMQSSDRTLDNTTAVQGIASVRAGSVSISFKDFQDTYMSVGMIVPNMVMYMMPAWWFTEETLEPAYPGGPAGSGAFMFEVID